jgi:transposase
VLSLPPSVRVFLATQPVDGRKGVDSLAAMVRSVFSHDPLTGHLYVFFSKRCDRVRVMYWDRNGFALWTKRLERGRFHVPFEREGELSVTALEAGDLGLILEGIELAGARRRPRWEPRRTSGWEKEEKMISGGN